MRTVALEYLLPDLALGILDEKPPLRPLKQDDEGNHAKRHDHDAQNDESG